MKKSVFKTLALVLGLGLVLSAGSKVLAYRGDPEVEGPNCTDERKEEMSQVMESGDYEAWKEMKQGRGRITEVVTEENFDRFAEMHQLRLEGREEEADVIRQELGLGEKLGQRQAKRGGWHSQ